MSARGQKLLLVTGFFPPYSPLGAVRPPSLAAYWQALGYDVRVITIENPAISGMLPSPLPAESVQYVPFSEKGGGLEKVVDTIKKITLSNGGDPGGKDGSGVAVAAQRSGGTPEHVRFQELRLFYRQVVMFPDRYRSWINPAVKAGLALAESWKPDLIYSSCPPHSGHIVAQRLAKQLGVPWIAELRDLWANNPYNDTHPIIQPIQKLVANSVLRQATACVALTNSAAREVEETIHRPTIVSYNGYGADDFAGLEDVAPEDPEHLTIIHAGIIYAGRRDPTTLFQALAIMGRKRHKVRVKFYHDSLASVARSALQLGVSECVEICAPIPRREILRLERAVDVLLLCRWANPADDGIIPGKLFEYIGSRRPILGVGSTAGEAADIIRRHAFGVVSNSPVEIARELSAWIEMKAAAGGRIPDTPVEPIAAFVREEQFKKVSDLIADVLARSGIAQGKSQ